jgi:PIN domain nuclease of toxin-antitoxin system
VLQQGRRDGELAIADVTLREIAEAVSRKRIVVAGPAERYLAFVESLFRVVPIDARIAYRSTQFSAQYPKDPADRLIGATAIVHVAKLVTRDDAIRASGEVDCVW